MERIRQARLEERMTHLQEAEKRRPDYLKRAQRSLDEPDSVYLDDMTFDDDSWPAVGVTDSPQKGRRLKLFQETSEESFEESLMAGGYGRYVRSSSYCITSLLKARIANCRMDPTTPTLFSCAQRSRI